MLPKKPSQIVFILIMAFGMSIIMCAVVTAVNTGTDSEYLNRFFNAWIYAWLIIIIFSLVMQPVFNIFVAPMFIGTGLQNKLLEAMSMGLPCITTTLANNALLANPSQIITANNAEEFANASIKLLTNEKLANNLKNEGLKFIQEKYDWKKINYKLSSLFK